MSFKLRNYGEVLAQRIAENSIVDPKELSRAQSLSGSEKLRLDRALLKLGLVDEDRLIPILADILGCHQYMDPRQLSLDQSCVEKLTKPYCRSHGIVPVINGRNLALILTSDPGNSALAEELAFHLEGDVVLAAAPTRLIRALLSSSADQEQQDDLLTSEERLQEDQDIVRQSNADGPVIRFVAEIFDEAVAQGASDIHFEAQEDGLRVRMRVKGTLKPQPIDHSLGVSSVLARVKVMATMNVSERRLPQDGRITSNIAGRKVDFRVSSVPTSFGESIVCRVLDPNALRLGWEKLGFDAEITQRIIELIEQPSGLFLVTGPTGSGKTTTLYTALSHLNREGRKILTIEDPIEYNLPGVEQVQVHEAIGMTFAKALRSFLRQDPNVIMVGEIRDQETAEIACRAALMGRMVLSTLHTNSPEGAVTRLTDLGVPEFIVNDVLRGTIGQRLEASGGGLQKFTARLTI